MEREMEMEMETCEEHGTLRKHKRARLAAPVGDEDEIGETRFLIRQEERCRHAWCVITWSEKKGEFRYSSYEDIQSYPDDIEHLRGSATLLCDSKLFFIAGVNYLGCLLPSVHSFDTDCKTWKVHQDVKTPRCLHTATAVGDYIYVFGTDLGRSWSMNDFIPANEWGEQFNTKDNKWDYLPQPPNSLFDAPLYEPRSYAVYHNCPAFSYTIYLPQLDSDSIQFPPVHVYPTADFLQVDPIQIPDVIANQFPQTVDVDANQTEHHVDANQTLILFPLPCSGSPICVFNCTSNKWLPTMKPAFSALDDPIIFPNPPIIQDRLVIVDGVLIWHCVGSINGYDLINQKCLGSLYTIPLDQLEQNFSGDPMEPHGSTMFFVHKGDSLFLYFQIMECPYTIHCYKFGVQKRKQGQDFCLHCDNYQQLSTESMEQDNLLDVFLL